MKRAVWLFCGFQLLSWGLYVLLLPLLHPKTIEIISFFTAQALLVFCYASYAIRKARKFYLLLAEVVLFRLSTACIYVALVLWIGVQSPFAFVIHFAVLYLAYLLFELLLFFHIFAKSNGPIPSPTQESTKQASLNPKA